VPENTPFGNAPVSARTPVIEANSVFGASRLRNVIRTAGAGGVTSSGGGLRLATTAAGADSVVLETAEIGRYQSGFAAECGIGVRFPAAALTGNQVARWGYFDDANGFGWGRDAAGVYVWTRRGGVETAVRQAAWNNDRLDGSRGLFNASGNTLDVARGQNWQVDMTWAYGMVAFSVVLPETDAGPGYLRQRPITVHRINPSGQTSTLNPNLPVSASLHNNGTAAAAEMFVADRHYSILGHYEPSDRVTSDRVLSKALTTAWTPVISWRRKVTGFEAVSLLTEGYGIIVATNNVLLQVRLNTTLTGAVWATPSETSPDETALERDITGTAFAGGEKVFGALHAAGGQATRTLDPHEFEIRVPRSQILSLVARSTTGTASVDLSSRMLEEW
jgi:hypothetical protein